MRTWESRLSIRYIIEVYNFKIKANIMIGLGPRDGMANETRTCNEPRCNDVYLFDIS